MKLLRPLCTNALSHLAAVAVSLFCAFAHAGLTVPVIVPIEVDVVVSPPPVTAPTVTGSFTYSVVCTDSQGGTSAFTFPSPALTLTATALATPFNPKPSGNATALQQSGSFEIFDPGSCVVTQLTRPAAPTGYAWSSTPVAPITVANFSNNETRIAPDSTASFSNTLIPATYTVTGVASPPAGGTVNCTSPVNSGSTTTCTTTTSTGYTLTGITSTCGAPSSGPGYTTGAVTANCTVTATFSQNTYVVTGVANPLAGGTVNCTSPVTHGNTTTCTTTTSVGYTLTGITSTCGSPSSGPGYTTGAVTAACTVTGTFSQNTYVVTGVANPLAGGTVTCASPVAHGNTTTCTTTPNTGYTLTGITSTCGAAAAGPGYTTGAVTGNCTVTAAFSLNSYPITTTVTPAAGGTLVCVPNPVNHGATATCTATPNAGYSFTPAKPTSTSGPKAAISGCGGVATTSGNTFTTGAITAPCTVSATFTLNTFVVTGVASPLAGGSVVCTSPVNFNATSSCTATANVGYTLTGISGCGGTASTTSPYTTGAVTAACTVTGTFALNTYPITTVANPTAGGSVTCAPNPANFGTTSTCTATPNAGYALSSIFGCSGASSTSSPYTTGTISTACTVTANFTQISFPVTTLVVVAGGGTLNCTPNPVAFGATATCVAAANAGYALLSISGCGGTATATNPFITGPITSACTVTAQFNVVVAPAVAVPTLAQWALVLLSLLIVASGYLLRTRRMR
jgi:Divergent InlB B-repeat domain